MITESESSAVVAYVRSVHPTHVIEARMRWGNVLHPIYTWNGKDLNKELARVQASSLEDAVALYAYDPSNINNPLKLLESFTLETAE